MPSLTLFLDDGGVLSDNRVRAPQWQRLVSAFFAPRLGGTPDDWAAANRVVMERFFMPGIWEERLRAASDYASFDRAYQLDWLGSMCALVGVPAPPEDQMLALAHEVSAAIPPQIRAAFPGAADAVRTLYNEGYVLHTASGESSRDLDGYLSGMGVRECFGRLYGPDLVDTLKDGPAYYRRIFADAGVDPARALVVDDNPRVLGWVAAVGARTALVGPLDGPLPAGTPRLPRLADLPAWLAAGG